MNFNNFLLVPIFLITFCTIIHCEDSFATENGQFALNFYKQIIKSPENADKSFVFSPFSIQTAGGLLYGAAKGKTADEMYKGFHLVSKDAHVVGDSFKSMLDTRVNDPSMNILNKVYVKDGETIAPTYKEIAKSQFNSEIENIKFAQNVEAAKLMNKWIEEKTNGKIKDFITPDKVNSDTVMFLLNVMNFKGQWKLKFKKEDTEKKEFHLPDGTVTKVDMMKTIGKYKFEFITELNAKGISIPFKDTDLSMYIILPVGGEYKLDTLESNLLKLKLHDVLFKAKHENEVVLSLPKFKTEFSIDDMQEIFENLKMKSMFGREADFSNLLESNVLSLYVSAAIHKSVFEIDETGASGAATSGTGTSSRVGPIIFNANKSFIYLIKGGNNEIYFMGRYTGK